MGPTQNINVTVRKEGGCLRGCGTVILILLVLGAILAIGIGKILAVLGIVVVIAVGIGVVAYAMRISKSK